MRIIRGHMEKHMDGVCSSRKFLIHHHFPDMRSTLCWKNAIRTCHVCTSSAINCRKRKQMTYVQWIWGWTVCSSPLQGILIQKVLKRQNESNAYRVNGVFLITSVTEQIQEDTFLKVFLTLV
jgi:hypothetical protein